MPLRVLLVDDDRERAARVSSALHAAGYCVAAHLDSASELLAQVYRHRPDVIVIDRDSPDRDTLEHVCLVTRDAPRPIVLFTQERDPAPMRVALKAGVSAYVVNGLSPERVRAVVDVAMARFEEHQALKRELHDARTSLAERKLIERAKGIVMKQRGCTEDEAYRLLRKRAMERHQKLVQVAESVIAAAELLT